MGHKQLEFEKVHWKFRDQHGGVLRNKRRGRKARPLTTKAPVHLVFKIDRRKIKKGFRSPHGFAICNQVIKRYAKRFFIKIDQLAIAGDHIHLIIRISRRSFGQYFFRVVAGQIAQRMKNEGLWVTDTPFVWKLRPFTRVIRGWKAYNVARNYVMLNHKEAEGEIAYRKERLRGLSSAEWELLWS
ncbi:MAG: transposase [Bdellovibrionaceae bacterium]|nr:transposase [Bdellovibrio sp.]